jgi:hypothetical protein
VFGPNNAILTSHTFYIFLMWDPINFSLTHIYTQQSPPHWTNPPSLMGFFTFLKASHVQELREPTQLQTIRVPNNPSQKTKLGHYRCWEINTFGESFCNAFTITCCTNKSLTRLCHNSKLTDPSNFIMSNFIEDVPITVIVETDSNTNCCYYAQQ